MTVGRRALALLVAVLLAHAAGAQEEGPIIAEVVVEGGVTVTLDTVTYYLGLEAGDPLEQEVIAEGFHRLWDSGLFETIRIESEGTEDGEVVLYVVVTERPFIDTVTFEGNKKISSSDMKDKLDEKGVDVPRNVPLKMSQLSRIESALKEIYDEEGFRSAQISYEVVDKGRNRRDVIFRIEEGGKVKIEDIEFVGNEVFSDSKLRGALKEVKAVSLYRKWGKKIIYTRENWEADRDNLRNFYLNAGYLDVKIGEPVLELVANNPDAETLEKMKYRMRVTIPVEEGEPYSVNSLAIEGVEIFNADGMKQFFEVEMGSTYSKKAFDAAKERIQELYHNSGYIYAYAGERFERVEDKPLAVDVVVDVFEGERYSLGRIEFVGNSTTRDKVLRREFRLVEGNWMNMGALKSSVFKVNALGFWKLEEDPLEFDFDDELKRVNVSVKGNEVGRNDIQFGAGYSELDGFFVQAQFNTRNFLGRGNTLGVSLQVGRNADFYTLSYTEPYFLDRRILLGGSVFKTNQEVADYFRETTGFSISLGKGLRAFSSITGIYSWEDVQSRYQVSRLGVPGDPTGGHVPPISVPPVDPITLERYFEEFAGRTASFTPSFTYDNRDDPFNTSRGRRLNARLRMAGGLLGGDFDYLRPEVTLTQWVPYDRKHKFIFAFNAEVGQFFPYNDSEMPIYERYRLGGDRSLRGIPYYTVLPRTEDLRFFLNENGVREGGDRYWLLNLEQQFALGGPVKLVFFFDVGNTYHEDQGWEPSLYRKTTGVELRVLLPIFQAPIRFIYGYNLDPWPEEDQSDFQFSIGTTF
ncbi:MAG: outer membrane protein assembly factor BamA [Thermoanaerobaculales bacterium]|jgi:outer membrane protein insertion porin family|nr:outer membrane protein assembly factor BamA [Thermoanaerobaculales bacterium]